VTKGDSMDALHTGQRMGPGEGAMTRAIHRAALLLAATTGFLACGNEPPPRSPAAHAPPAPLKALVDDRWGRFRSHRFGRSVPLPDGTRWKIDDHSSSWLVAQHPDTDTTFRARVWLEPKPMSHAACEANARRLAPDLPLIAGQGTIDDHLIVDTPAVGFETRIVVGLHDTNAASDSVGGHVLAFGAAGRKCVAIAFTTNAQGPRGSAVLGARLELGARIVETTILMDSIPRGPLVSPAGAFSDHR
jgi:hypothetical protein